MAAILTGLEPRDVLFVDEIHRVNRAIEEILYPALEDFRLDIVVGQGAGGADAHARPPAVHARRRDDPHRSPDDAAPRPLRHDVPARLLRAGRARDDRPPLGGDPRRRDRRRGGRRDRAASARHAAGREPHPPPRSATSPRCATRVPSRSTSRARRSSCSRSTRPGSSASIASCSAPIAHKFGGGPVGLSTLAVSLGEEPDTIEDVYEPYLLQLGFLQRTPRGRVITALGREHIGAARDRRRAVLTMSTPLWTPGVPGRSTSSSHGSRAWSRRSRRSTGSSRRRSGSSSSTARATRSRRRAPSRASASSRSRRIATEDEEPRRLIVPIGAVRSIEISAPDPSGPFGFVADRVAVAVSRGTAARARKERARARAASARPAAPRSRSRRCRRSTTRRAGPP